MKYLPIVLISTLLLFASCKKTPDHVIPEGDMAELLADLQIADAVIEINRQEYPDEQQRMQLRYSILNEHGFTEEQFDTSLIWYGHNLDIYKTVCENTVKILESRQKDIIAEAKEAGEKLTMAGDSIDIWQIGKNAIFERKRIGDYAHFNFAIAADENSKPGDKYEWRLFLKNASENGNALIGIDYADGTSDIVKRELRANELLKLNIQSDSNLNVSRVFGTMMYKLKEDAVFLDSMTLYRSRLNSGHYHRYGTKHIK